MMRRLLLMALLLPAMAQAQNMASADVTLPAGAEEVWRLMTTEEGQESWLYPGAVIDLRIGGAMRSGAAAEQVLDLTWPMNGEIISFEPARMLSLADATASGSDSRPWCVILLTPVSGKQTQVRVSAMGYPDSAFGVALMGRLKNEYQAALGRLAVHLGAAPVSAVPVVPAAAPVARVTAATPDIDAEMTKEEVAVEEAEKDEAGAGRDLEPPDSVSDHFIPD